ncbi:MAG: indole-3-glycerol-phosphate synthase [Desulfovibrionaceae bacterium]
MLDRFRAAKAAEIAELKRRMSAGDFPRPWGGPRPGFSAALRAKGPGAVIAEYKRASPSKGVINLDRGPAEVAALYAASGAAAMSVLTEETFFQGSLEFLEAARGSGLPLLRKDFLFEPCQVVATAATPASALLLIARYFDEPAPLGRLISLSEAAGLEAVVEVFDEHDLTRARAAGASLIQVNNRDLDILTVNLDVSRRMSLRMRQAPRPELWISASGVERRDQVEELAGLGYAAVLVGTSIMADPDPAARLRRLTGLEPEPEPRTEARP